MEPLRHSAEGEELRFHQRQDVVGILSFRAFQIQQRGEIGVYGRSELTSWQ